MVESNNKLSMDVSRRAKLDIVATMSIIVSGLVSVAIQAKKLTPTKIDDNSDGSRDVGEKDC